jgi:hypothetical protein
MSKVLILWDEFGQQDGDMKAYLIEPSNEKSRKRLLSMHGQFVNSSRTKDSNYVNEFSDLVYAEDKDKLSKYQVKWPIKLHESVVIVHTGFLP